MKILMISDFYAPYLGGVEVHVGALGRGLVDRGHSVAVVTLAGNGEVGSSFDDGVQVFRIEGLSARFQQTNPPGSRPWSPHFPILKRSWRCETPLSSLTRT